MPLSAEESIPWHGPRLNIGTGMHGMPADHARSLAVGEQKGIAIMALPTPELCAKVAKLKRMDANASLHVTC
jgi:hypothetical protein